VGDVFTTLHVALTEASDDHLDRNSNGLVLTSVPLVKPRD